MTIKKKLFVILIILLTTIIGVYIGGNLLFSLGMGVPKNEISQEEVQFGSEFGKKHPESTCTVSYKKKSKFKHISIDYNSGINQDYNDNVYKKFLADSIFQSFIKIKQKYYSDSLIIEFRDYYYKEDLSGRVIEGENKEFRYEMPK